MLLELTITDFAIIDRLHLNLATGFNVLTGETGAGKSIIIDAVSLLLGARPEVTSVRAGCERALIEGVFELPASAELRDLLEANELTNDEEADRLWLAREIRSGGRSTARVNGRAVPSSLLREIGEALIDIHGQSEHLSLLRPKEHVNLLDRYADTWELREQVARLVAQWRAVHKELGELLKSEAELARRADMLKFQIDEIRAAKLKPGEDDELMLEQKRLANAEALAQFADEAYAALYEGDGETPAALDALAKAHKALTGLAKIDPKFAEYISTLTSVVAQVDDLAREAKRYREAIQYSPNASRWCVATATGCCTRSVGLGRTYRRRDKPPASVYRKRLKLSSTICVWRARDLASNSSMSLIRMARSWARSGWPLMAPASIGWSFSSRRTWAWG